MHDNEDRRRPTEEPNRADAATEPTGTMGSVSHTNPVTGEPFGESQVYARGRTVVADGGEADAEDDDTPADEQVARVKDMDHTPREGAPAASGVYERGGEGEMDEGREEATDEEAADVPEAAEE